MKYVVGFLFSPGKRRVALIRKNKPQWQAGMLNGIGGKIEEGETPEQAMQREFKEETGANVTGWKHTFTLSNPAGSTAPGYEVQFFRAFHEKINELQSPEDEQVEVVKVAEVPNLNLIWNLNWLIPMSLDPCISWPVVIPSDGISRSPY